MSLEIESKKMEEKESKNDEKHKLFRLFEMKPSEFGGYEFGGIVFLWFNTKINASATFEHSNETYAKANKYSKDLASDIILKILKQHQHLTIPYCPFFKPHNINGKPIINLKSKNMANFEGYLFAFAIFVSEFRGPDLYALLDYWKFDSSSPEIFHSKFNKFLLNYTKNDEEISIWVAINN